MTARLVAVLCAMLAVTTACATVPVETKPEAVGGDAIRPPDAAAAEPELDLAPVEVVRKFVEKNARRGDDYPTSRAYLDEDVREKWKPGESIVILRDVFNTVPAARQPEDPNERIVRLTGLQLGTVVPDDSFQPSPADQPYTAEFRLHRQRDNQWRIAELPDQAVTTKQEFELRNHAVPVYFFAPDSNVRVPDTRYLPKEPKEDQPNRVLDALLGGPSPSLADAVDNPLENAKLERNVIAHPDVLQVSLTDIESEEEAARRRIIAQVVMSLDGVTGKRIRVLSDGNPVLNERTDWTTGDLPSYNPRTSDQPGMAIRDGRLVSLGDMSPVPGPAGDGSIVVDSAAQSVDGSRIAVVQRRGKKSLLRIGPAGGGSLYTTKITGSRLARPTWSPTKTNDEVWTVVGRQDVVRATLRSDGTWSEQTVNTTALVSFGQISALRLSRDGTRAAIVAGDKLVVASVVRTPEFVMLRRGRILQPELVSDVGRVVDVDWLTQDSLVIATALESVRVAKVSVDGLRAERFNRSNLIGDVSAVAAAPGGSVVVANDSGLWVAATVTEVWSQFTPSAPGVVQPFFPG